MEEAFPSSSKERARLPAPKGRARLSQAVAAAPAERHPRENFMRRAAPFLAAIVGLILFGQGAYIHAKALLAQVLLQYAFAETVATGRITKPWSWADTWPIARIEVRRIHASAIVLEGS